MAIIFIAFEVRFLILELPLKRLAPMPIALGWGVELKVQGCVILSS